MDVITYKLNHIKGASGDERWVENPNMLETSKRKMWKSNHKKVELDIMFKIS